MPHPFLILAAVALLAGPVAPAQAADAGTPEAAGLAIQPLGVRARFDSRLRLEMADSLRARLSARRAGASAVVYTNRRGQITGVRLRAAGLPDADRLGAGAERYVVWLVGQSGRRTLRLGELECRNGARADFGFTAGAPLGGFERLLVTAEPRGPATGPTGRAQLSADLTRMILSRL